MLIIPDVGLGKKYKEFLNSLIFKLLPSEFTSIYADLISELSSLPSVTLSLTV